MELKKTKGFLMIAFVLLIVLTVTACTGKKESSTASASAVQEGGKVDPSKLKVAVALGWMANESGWRMKEGFAEALAEYGVPEKNITYFDANYDPVVQSQQIGSVVEAKPDLLFVVAANTDGLSEAVHGALQAGVPVFTVFNIKGVEKEVTCQVANDDYSEGAATMEYLAKKLGYKGNICLIKLDPNPTWKLRSDAAADVIAKYPDMKIINEWSWDPTGVNTPRQAVDGFLAASPQKGSIGAIWAAWDTACFEGIEACKAAGRTEIIFGGQDGSQMSCETLLESDQFVVSVGSGIFSITYDLMNTGFDYLNGKQIKQSIFSESTILDKESLSRIQLKPGQNLGDYDRTGVAKEWGLASVPAVTPK
jgi:ribose transport system substrate-binding protein